MIDNLSKHLVGIAVGIRYRANFSIEDQLGKIVDQILYSKGSYFNAEVFPKVYTNLNEKTLINEATRDHLIINNSNTILEVNFDEQFETSELQDILQQFNSEIVDGIMKRFKVTEINRVGLVHRYLFKMEDLAKSFINKTIGGTLEGINDINLRFSKKMPTEEGLIKKGVNDYHSAIFNVIKMADKQELFMSIDYQKYFDPFLPTAAEIGFLAFTDKANNFNSGSYLNWLNKNYGVLK